MARFSSKGVKELFKNVLHFLVDNDHVERIPLLWGTGSKRYVISNEVNPTHPNGREFFLPVKYKGYSLETHMARDRSMKVLDDLCNKLQIEFETIDV